MVNIDSKLTALLSQKSYLNQQTDNKGLTQQQPQVSQTRSFVQLSRTDVESFSMFNKTVQKRVGEAVPNNFNELETQELERLLAERDERAELAAGNILTFVERQLRADVQDGATQEQLESRLNAALEGFEKGFGEANDILGNNGLLSDSLSEEIGLTRDKVLAGLNELKKSYIDDAETAVAEPEETAKAVEAAIDTDNIKRGLGSQLANFSAAQVGEARDFSFQLTTQDGDVVTINASALYAAQYEQASGTRGGANVSTLSFESYEESQFSLFIEGELDEDELAAINDLLSNVNDLADEFYNGDMSVAFEKAMSLGFDSEEISGFALSLTQVKSVRAIQAYQPEQEILKPNVMAELKPIGKFAQELAQSLTLAKEHFSEAKALMESLFEEFEQQKVGSSDSGKSVTVFAVSLMEQFERIEQFNKQ